MQTVSFQLRVLQSSISCSRGSSRLRGMLLIGENCSKRKQFQNLEINQRELAY